MGRYESNVRAHPAFLLFRACQKGCIVTQIPSLRGLLATVKIQRRPAKFLVATALRKLRLSSLFLIRRRDFILRFHPTSHSASLWADPQGWSHDQEIFRRYLRPGDTVVDVGANIGYLSLIASKVVGGTGRVLAIEPHPKIFRFMCKNIALNRAGNIQPLNCAIGDHESDAVLTDISADDQNAITKGAGVSVPMRSLDMLTKGFNHIALLKIDVEGYERFVLQGAEQTLRKTECIYFESWDVHFANYGYSFSDVLMHLRGFEVYKSEEGGMVGPFDAAHRSPRCENLLAIRNLGDFVQRTGWELRAAPAHPSMVRPSVHRGAAS